MIQMITEKSDVCRVEQEKIHSAEKKIENGDLYKNFHYNQLQSPKSSNME